MGPIPRNIHAGRCAVALATALFVYGVARPAQAQTTNELDQEHQILIALTEAAQGTVAGLLEDEDATVERSSLRISGEWNEVGGRAQVLGNVGDLAIDFDVYASQDAATGAMALRIAGRNVQAQGTAEYLRLSNALTANEPVLDINLDGDIVIGPRRPWDLEIVKFFTVARGGRLITDRGVKTITRGGVIRAKYVEFSAWSVGFFDRIIEQRIFPRSAGPLTLGLELSVISERRAFVGAIVVQPGGSVTLR